MSEFKSYRRVQKAELRPVTKEDIKLFHEYHLSSMASDDLWKISISNEDIKNGSPRIGDMIARNPNNHDDQWLVAKEYFDANFT